MKIVFMGTPAFARSILVTLVNSEHEIVAVVTGQDKRSGRKQRLTPTDVRLEADKHGFKLFTPKSLKSKQLREDLDRFKADLFVVAAFRILPEELYSLPKYGSINIHASLLPAYRGAAPINWAIINGETKTGLTSFFLKMQVDTGDIILQESIEINPEENFDIVHDRLAGLAGPFLLKTLALIEQGDKNSVPQSDIDVTEAPKLLPSDGLIDFSLPCKQVHDFIRGMSTRPGAYTFFKGERLKINAATIVDFDDHVEKKPGMIISDRKKLLVQCGSGLIELLIVVPSGKKPMAGQSFINGFRPKENELFGENLEGV